MEMEFSKMERIVGTFIVGVLLLMVTTLVMIGRGKDWFEKYVTYYTTFNETYNLQENAAVKLFRADIGKVREISLEDNRVRVKVAILEKYASRIREDTVAVVESPTLIGSEYIAIMPGSADAPLIAEGGEIPSREKRSLTDLLADFEIEKTATMVLKSMQEVSAVTEILSDPEGPLLRSLNNIARITADLEAGRGPMGLLIKSEDLLQQIVDHIETLGGILANIDTAVAQAPDIMAWTRNNLVLLHDTGQDLRSGIDETRQVLSALQQASGDLQTVMDNLATGSHHVPPITTTFRHGIQEIRQGVEQINRVVDAMQQSVFIRSNLPPEPGPPAMDPGARP